MSTFHHSLRRLAMLLLGLVFLFSGLLKIEDPVGTMLIVTAYCKFFHLGFLIPAAKGIGIALACFEAMLGVTLITGVLRRLTGWCCFALTGLFTLVTLALWIANPDMDCGCFGEAIHLTHAQSFWKNVVLLGLCFLAFLPVRHLGHPKKNRVVAACIGAVSIVVAIFYCNTHLPPTDFTDFRLGAELLASLDDDVAADNHYTPVFIYEKNGQRGVFPLDALPDSSWTFVDRDTLFRPNSLIYDDYPILSFYDSDGKYWDRLAAVGRVVVFSIYDWHAADWGRLEQQYNAVLTAGGIPLVLVASYPSEPGLPASLPLYFADYKTLITLNRSNGGGSYFCEGELIDKWPAHRFPADLSAHLQSDPITLSTHRIVRNRLKAQGFCVYLLAVLLLV